MNRIAHALIIMFILVITLGCASGTPITSMATATLSAPQKIDVPMNALVKITNGSGKMVTLNFGRALVGTHFTETGDLYVTLDVDGWVRGGGDQDHRFSLSFDERHPGERVTVDIFGGSESITFTWENNRVFLNCSGNVGVFIDPMYKYQPDWEMNA